MMMSLRSTTSTTKVEVLSCIRHPNMVLLLRACPEYGCLVYEYMANRSLDECLFRWERQMVKIHFQHPKLFLLEAHNHDLCREAKLIERAKALKVNAGTEPDTDLGPVISKQAKERIHKLVQSGVESGAKLLLDGRNIVHAYYLTLQATSSVLSSIATEKERDECIRVWLK